MSAMCQMLSVSTEPEPMLYGSDDKPIIQPDEMAYLNARMPRYVVDVKGDMVIRTSDETDRPYIKHLSRQESFALGWIPEGMYDRVWQGTFAGWILMCEVNLQPVGFCFAAPPYQAPYYGRIYQLAVQADARRYDYGTALAEVSHSLVGKCNGNGTLLRCAEDLPANFFWNTLGWKLDSIVPKGSGVGDSPRQTRRTIHRRLRLIQDSLFVTK